jgi:glycosyltransferase involved in cell wall biosynthesis
MNICIAAPYFMPFIRSNEYGLARSLSDRGHNVTIIASKSRAPREKMVHGHYPYPHDFEIKYLRTVLDIADNPIVTSIDVRGFDAVMLQEDYPFLCHGAYASAKKHGIATVLSSERTYYPENLVKRLALKILDASTNKKLREGVNVLTAHCSAAREFMINELGVKREIKVIPVGVDTKIFRPLPSRNKYLGEGDLKLLTVARLYPYKGLEYLIKAMELVRKKEPRAMLYILGKGQEEKNLRKLVNQLKLSNVVFIKEVIPNHLMPELYAECDVYVQPSVIEPFGIAVLEAMACGKPVIGTSVGGMRDTIIDGESGCLVPPKNVEKLAGAILNLSGQELSKRGLKARERASLRFDWDLIAAEYEKILINLGG